MQFKLELREEKGAYNKEDEKIEYHERAKKWFNNVNESRNYFSVKAKKLNKNSLDFFMLQRVNFSARSIFNRFCALLEPWKFNWKLLCGLDEWENEKSM